MKTRCFEPERAAALICVLASFLTALTCASGSLRTRGAAPAGSQAPSAIASASAAASELPDAGALAQTDATSDAGANTEHASALSLPRFFAALASGQRVRIVWLGDSHTAADYLPNAVREPLQRRFGNGGPGYLAIGIDKYRHGAVSVKSEGRWKREPSNPSAGAHANDAVLGLLGVRTIPVSADAKTEIELGASAVAGSARWELMFRAQKGARLRIRRDADRESRLDGHSGRSGPAGSPIRRASFETGPRGKLEIASGAGSPELYGVIVEGSSGGVVLDTLGIIGARVATVLSWDERAWGAELAARAPALVVIAYGTNEAAGSLSSERWERELATLQQRIESAAPHADCLMLGPIEMADKEGRSVPRVIEFDAAAERAAKQAGCGYYSLFRAMGGEGTIMRWLNETPALAMPDHVHLTGRGYEKLGATLADALLEAYDRYAADAASAQH